VGSILGCSALKRGNRMLDLIFLILGETVGEFKEGFNTNPDFFSAFCTRLL